MLAAGRLWHAEMPAEGSGCVGSSGTVAVGQEAVVHMPWEGGDVYDQLPSLTPVILPTAIRGAGGSP